ncbi:Cyclin-dependent protein kinase inhibitor [Rhodotorula toruloides ATCC 204091]|uniref:Peroxisome assembly protein 12 n=1 Tax=Rhodotorula toruloides TaxID=5286 RepID=A0A0K3CM52_RHOTO|nr:Cyclin-dependent protein kinase inhibitor [Rhodotorula toruloides ATCC 204091]KAK4333048.1 Cyclin-dependent protein kinase inhibitor [Rhodotorula toruloides]PRQ71269.1 cyclin-dependent protein kinase inhibitor [Rhodotorula toruloides]
MEYLGPGQAQDPYRPSIFELAAQDQLRDLLSPVVRYVLSVFAQRNPRYLLRIVNHHDSLFALCMYFVERHYLVTHGGSFAETFYGLKRRKVLGSGRGGPGEEKTKAAFELTGKSDRLGRKEVAGSLAFLVLMPYLKTKANDLYERLGGGVDADLFSSPAAPISSPLALLRNASLNPSLLTRLKLSSQALFKLSYPYVNLLWELYLLVYNLRYLFGKSPYWRPWFRLLGIEVRRMGQEDYERLNSIQTPLQKLFAAPHGAPPTTRPSIRLFLSRLIRLSPSLALDSLRLLLPLSIFGFRLLEWWYSPTGGAGRLGRGSKKGSQPALRAPPLPPSSASADSDERGKCVVHGGPVENPTALPSGWIGCYKCLRGLEEEVEDPVAGGAKRGTGRLRDPKTGEWVDVGRLRRIMG